MYLTTAPLAVAIGAVVEDVGSGYRALSRARTHLPDMMVGGDNSVWAPLTNINLHSRGRRMWSG